MSDTRVLIVANEGGQVPLLCSYLDDLPVEVTVAEGTVHALEALTRERFHAVLCDLVMPGGGGQEVLRFVRSQGLPTPVIILAGYGDEGTLEEYVTAGAFDFIAKPIDRLSLLALLRRALLRSELIFEERLVPPPGQPPPLRFPNLLGTSAAMQGVLWRIAKVAEADTNVCLYGESGTG
ncbi:MAG TPA: response regulator, partial [archaeon]|nr:response regulator [archaeon]